MRIRFLIKRLIKSIKLNIFEKESILIMAKIYEDYFYTKKTNDNNSLPLASITNNSSMF